MQRIPLTDIVRAALTDLALNSIEKDRFLATLGLKSPNLKKRFDDFEAGRPTTGNLNPVSVKLIRDALVAEGSHDNPNVTRLQREVIGLPPAHEGEGTLYQKVFQPLTNVQRERGYQLKNLFGSETKASFIVLMNDIAPDHVILVDLVLNKKGEHIEFEFGRRSREKMLGDNPDLSTSHYAAYSGVAHITEEYLYCFGTCPQKEHETYAPLYLIVDARNIGREIGFLGNMMSTFDRNKQVYSGKVVVGRVKSYDDCPLGSVKGNGDEKAVRIWLNKGFQKASPGGDDPPKSMTSMLKKLGCSLSNSKSR